MPSSGFVPTLLFLVASLPTPESSGRVPPFLGYNRKYRLSCCFRVQNGPLHATWVGYLPKLDMANPANDETAFIFWRISGRRSGKMTKIDQRFLGLVSLILMDVQMEGFGEVR